MDDSFNQYTIFSDPSPTHQLVNNNHNPSLVDKGMTSNVSKTVRTRHPFM